MTGLQFRHTARFLVAEVPPEAAPGEEIDEASFSEEVDSFHSPSFWWPEDRAWFLSTEVDAQSTYIGGSVGLVERLLADPEIEVLPAAPKGPFDGVHPGMRMRH